MIVCPGSTGARIAFSGIETTRVALGDGDEGAVEASAHDSTLDVLVVAAGMVLETGLVPVEAAEV